MGDNEEDHSVTEGARLYLITSVLLSFAAHVLTSRPIRPACSLGALHTYCLDTATAPREAHCVYCALAQARTWYTLMTGTPAAEMAEALTLAQADAERQHLHTLGGASSGPRTRRHIDDDFGKTVDRSAAHSLTNLAHARLRVATR